MHENTVIPTQARVQELLCYDPETGIFTWLIDRKGKAKAGTVAGRLNTNGHRQISIDNRRYMAGMLAWLYMTGEYHPEIDHENLDKDGNWFANLRPATRSQNMRNVAIFKSSSTGFKGVSKRRGRFVARIMTDSGRKYLGAFAEASDAGKAYAEAAKTYHGAFARITSQEKN